MKRIMRTFKMNEISAVNSPAQKPARAVIMKRDQNCPDPDDDEDDDAGAGNDPGKTGKVKKETLMTDLEKKVADLEAQVASLQKSNTELSQQKDALTKAAADAQAEVEALKKAADLAKNDETFEAEGVTIRKSEAGEGTFKVLKAQQERIELAAFEKSAQADVPFLPGDLTMKAKVLRAIAKMDKDVREAAEQMLKAGSAALQTTTKSVGTDGDKTFSKAEDELDALAKQHAQEHKVSYAKAYADVCETEKGRELYAKMRSEKRAA